jgi:hypothetical protein
MKAVPTTQADAFSLSQPDISGGAESAADTGGAPEEQLQPVPETDFTRYLLLAIKVGLAGIAIAAGLSTLILRLRAGQ